MQCFKCFHCRCAAAAAAAAVAAVAADAVAHTTGGYLAADVVVFEAGVAAKQLHKLLQLRRHQTNSRPLNEGDEDIGKSGSGDIYYIVL